MSKVNPWEMDQFGINHYSDNSRFKIKDSGKREQFLSGMQRDTAEDKIDYSLIFDGPMLQRWAQHLTIGAKKYEKRNWMKANGSEELQRFRESAIRHFIQDIRGDKDEDHKAAVFFNLNGIAYVEEQQRTIGAGGFTLSYAISHRFNPSEAYCIDDGLGTNHYFCKECNCCNTAGCDAYKVHPW